MIYYLLLDLISETTGGLIHTCCDPFFGRSESLSHSSSIQVDSNATVRILLSNVRVDTVALNFSKIFRCYQITTKLL